MSIVVQLLKNTQAWVLALIITFTPTSKAGLVFSSNGKAITITRYNPQASGSLIIRSTINNLPVTSIPEGAFYGCSGLKSVYFMGNAPSIRARLARWRIFVSSFVIALSSAADLSIVFTDAKTETTLHTP